MFPSFKLPSFRPRARSLSNPPKGEIFNLCKPPKTPVGSPKEKRNRRSNLFKRGNSDLGSTPSIASLQPGSVALTCDQLVPGDKIQSVNGINTSRMRPSNVSTLLENIDGNALLEIGYTLPHYASQNSLSFIPKVTEVTLERIDGSIGITLRGGAVLEQPNLSRPLVITHVRPNGPAARTGLIRVGDRVLKVDNQTLANKTLLEAQKILRDSCISTNQQGITITTLTIEYEVNVMDTVKYATGPLLVEIDRQVEEDFGLVLSNYNDSGAEDILPVGYFLKHVIPGSTADRCGALNAGDQVLVIDDLHMDEYNGTPNDAERLLRKAKKLQILPCHTLQRCSKNYGYGQFPSNPSISGFSTLNSRRSRRKNLSNRQSTIHKSFDFDSGSTSYGLSNSIGVCHPESLNITIYSDRGLGYGLNVGVSEHTENKSADILITRICPESPAFRCGSLQTGDRVVAINHQFNLTLQEINSILECGNEPNKTNQITLQIEFDVADTIVPSSGVFTVKLAKRGPDLGITITASKTAPEDPFIISEIRRGSIAHRTGTLHAGDRLLSIENRPLTHLTIESALDILHSSTNEIITLRIEKTETENDNLFLDSIVYMVELHRYGGPLGITISGSEDCLEPIVLSKISEGGLADKTGALHVGDRILAINGENLENRCLSDAIRLLQTSGDRVQLKIARNLKPTESRTNHLINDFSQEIISRDTNLPTDLGDTNLDERCNYSSPDGVMSIDSAIHSWDSNIPDHMESLLEIKDEESVISEPISISCQEKDTTLTKQEKHDSQLQFYSDAEEIYCPSPLPLPSYSFSNTLKYEMNRTHQSHNYYDDRILGCYSEESILGNDIFHVTLYKDSIYDDYGFSVSDGLYEKGVYVNKIRKEGPADIVGLLKPFDRIIQVNDTKTQEFDCCLTVPLIASAGDRIELIIARNPYSNNGEKDLQDNYSKKSPLPHQNTITKTL